MLTHSEENYLKSIYNLSSKTKQPVNTNAVANKLNTKPASATDMIQKLANKGLASYYKYKGVRLTEVGDKAALKIIRKHRLWEVFLVQELNFSWNEVHEIAEQLEHIKSPKLIERLDAYLKFPKFDPHGDPIPDAEGNMSSNPSTTLNMLETGDFGKIICAKDSSSDLLLYLDSIQISLGATIEIINYLEFDGSYSIKVNNKTAISISSKVAENLYIEKS